MSETKWTLRDRMAAAALQGILANPDTPSTWCHDRVATLAYEQADAMLLARARGEDPGKEGA